jgi:hypothetical protein
LCRGSAESITLVITIVKGLVNTVNANSVFVIVVGDVAILVVLIVIIAVALSKGLLLPSRSPNVLASHPPSVTPFWLVVMCKKLNGGYLRPLLCFIFVFFVVVQFTTPKKGKHPPIHSTPATHPLHHPSYRCRQLSAGCCVLRPNSGHLRPRIRPPLYFWMHLNLASQPREPAAARANPPPGTCNRLAGSRSIMIWGQGRCCHGDIGQICWG